MTLEELKAEAKVHGYRLVKIQPHIKLMPCKCGRKLIDTWCGPDGIFYKCPKCEHRGEVGKTDREARIQWNESVTDNG